MDIPTHSDLLARIEDFCTRHEMAESRFGRESVNNPAFVSSLRRDPPVSPTLETLNKLKVFMDETDEQARLRLKLSADPSPQDAGEECESELPFASAPVNPTGASSPTSSSTSEPLPPQEASGNSRCSSAKAA